MNMPYHVVIREISRPAHVRQSGSPGASVNWSPVQGTQLGGVPAIPVGHSAAGMSGTHVRHTGAGRHAKPVHTKPWPCLLHASQR